MSANILKIIHRKLHRIFFITNLSEIHSFTYHLGIYAYSYTFVYISEHLPLKPELLELLSDFPLSVAIQIRRVLH